MTTPTAPTAERIKAAKVFFEEQLKDRIAYDKKVAALDDPFGLVHPLYIGKRDEPYYRIILALLDAALANRKKDEPISEEAASLMDTTAGGRATADLVSVPAPQPEQSVGQEERSKLLHDRLSVWYGIGSERFGHENDEEVYREIYTLIDGLLSPPAPRKVSRESLAEAVIAYQITGPHNAFILVDDIQRFLYRLGMEVEDEL
jgi:hypothetical protein